MENQTDKVNYKLTEDVIRLIRLKEKQARQGMVKIEDVERLIDERFALSDNLNNLLKFKHEFKQSLKELGEKK
jgi:hypothetical protein